MEWYEIIDIITRPLLVILLGLNAFFLVKMIGRYSKLIRDQDKIIQAEKKDLEFIRSFVEGLKELALEREKMLKEKYEEEKKVMIEKAEAKEKELEGKTQTAEQAKRTIKTVVNDVWNLVSLIYRISLFSGAPPRIEQYINQMEATEFVKGEALKAFDKAREETKQFGISELTALLLRTPGLFEKKE